MGGLRVAIGAGSKHVWIPQQAFIMDWRKNLQTTLHHGYIFNVLSDAVNCPIEKKDEGDPKVGSSEFQGARDLNSLH